MAIRQRSRGLAPCTGIARARSGSSISARPAPFPSSTATTALTRMRSSLQPQRSPRAGRFATSRRCRSAQYCLRPDDLSGLTRVTRSDQHFRIDHIDRRARSVSNDLIEDVGELYLELVAGDVAEMRRAHDIVHAE